MMSIKLLSICIPTYNRAEILDNTLYKLFSNPDFDTNCIEVIVSDNCSTDNTAAVVSKYPLVHYYCNAENFFDYNFTISLGYAKGKYIKIFNDTFSFKPNVLNKMLERIRLHENENKNLFFYPNFIHNQNNKLEINSIASLLKECSFYTTWSASTGFWKKDFDAIEDKNRYTAFRFPQLEWMYRIVKNGNDTVIYFEDLFNVVIPPKKGGYDLFDTFINKYLFIIKQEKIDLITYEIEKYRLCRYYIYPNIMMLLVYEKDNYDFEINNPFKIIFKKYWYEPYFYLMLMLFFFKYSLEKK
jgi:glycosyltransferase involved in cell wall biosynthesis